MDQPKAIDRALARVISTAGIAYYIGRTKSWANARRVLVLEMNHSSPRVVKYIKALLSHEDGEMMFLEILNQWENDSKKASIMGRQDEAL